MSTPSARSALTISSVAAPCLEELEAEPFTRSFTIVAGCSATRPGGEPLQSDSTEMTAGFRFGQGDQNAWTE
jgi:hypothetical protein